MSDVISFPRGGYSFLKGVSQYSAAVYSQPGFRIERARFRKLLPLSDAFAAAQAHLERIGRPVTAFCACEQRSPEPFTEDGFAAFNREYVSWLEKWDMLHEGMNPVARTNVCPEVSPPDSVCFYAFSYTVPDPSQSTSGDFVIAGSGEVPEGQGNYRDHIVRRGDQSSDGLREKARWVLGEMERRMAANGFSWADITGTHLYTVHDIHPFIQAELAQRGVMDQGLSWHFARPPVVELDYEMDARGVSSEIMI